MLARRLFETARLRGDDGAELLLEYFLLCDEGGACRSYGAEIVLVRGAERESVCVRDITTSGARIARLLGLLHRNTVTPCTLYEVLDEALDKI